MSDVAAQDRDPSRRPGDAPDLTARDHLLSDLWTLLRHFSDTQDPALVMSDAAGDLGRAVWGSVAHPRADLEIELAVGSLHWFRYQHLPEGQGGWDLAAALELLGHVYCVRPDLVPYQFRRYREGTADALAARALEILERPSNTRDPHELARAIDLLERAVAATAPGDPARATRLNNLEYALMARGDLTRQLDDVDRAVEVARELVSLAVPGHQHRGRALASLGYALHSRFDLGGSAQDLDDAIDAEEQAIAATPSDDPDRSLLMSNLGDSLRRRFSHTYSAEDLDRAIAIDYEAATDCAPEHPDRFRALGNLALALRWRWTLAGSASDIDWAVELAEEAASITCLSDQERSKMLSELRDVLVSRISLITNPGDFDRAVDVAAEAVALTPPGKPQRGVRVRALCEALMIRAEHSRSLDDADRAVELGEEALSATPADDPVRLPFMSNLGDALRIRFDLSSDEADLDRALSLLRQVVESPVVPLSVRVRAARHSGDLAARAERWPMAVEALATAVELAELVTDTAWGRMGQEYHLRVTYGLGQSAAAACLEAGDVERAVELLERGRALLFSRTLQLRADTTDLKDADPQLHEELVRAREELERPIPLDEMRFGMSDTVVRLTAVDPQGADPTVVVRRPGRHPSSGAGVTAARQEAESRRRAAMTLENVLARIRQLPGFEQFMRPLRCADLLPAAAGGPVVLVNVAEARSDALILRPDGVQVVPLPQASPAVVIARVSKVFSGLDGALDPRSRTTTTAEAHLTEVLAWLWDAVTGPVLDHLGMTGSTGPADRSTRVYWCPTGMLTFAPLHAAGHHGTRFETRPLTVIDRVVSSSTPTVRALLQAGRCTPPPSRIASDSRALVVAMPQTPGHSDLRGAETEARILSDLLPDRVDVLGLPDGPPAERRTVLAALPAHAWAHFSCHGSADRGDPSASHLLLADHREHPLTVLDVARTALDGAQLAFLSACSTAVTGAALPDEPIHLAAGCQLAGYPHVIATLWPIRSNDAVRVTRDTYLTLSGEFPLADGAAYALHAATRGLRALYPDLPSRWAAYTHFGR